MMVPSGNRKLAGAITADDSRLHVSCQDEGLPDPDILEGFELLVHVEDLAVPGPPWMTAFGGPSVW